MSDGITIGQRQPRERDPRYLAFLRKKPCCACGRPGPSDAAHIRMASAKHDKRYVGLGETPDDRWALSLCRACHRKQHSMSEATFWGALGKDPFGIALELHRIGGTKPFVQMQASRKSSFSRALGPQRSATRPLDRKSDIYR